MNITFEKVFERDIDFLIINKLINDNLLLDYFLSIINKNGYKLIDIEHSLYDIQAGESDITAIVEKDNHKIGILIEDKIDAIAMPEQRKRYNIRGNKGIENGLYNEFFVFMIAPESYLNSNLEAKLYENQVSYEKLKVLLSNDLYASALIDKALDEKKQGYVIIENTAVTEFWSRLYKLIREEYPAIKFNEVKGPRGNNAQWPEFKTYYNFIKVILKSDRNKLDLTFSRMGKYPNIFHKYVDDVIDKDMIVDKTQKSMVIRLAIPIVDFKSDFDEQIDNVRLCLNNTIRLYEILKRIDVNSMYKEIEKN